MKTEQIKKTEWVKHWAGNWSLLSCSYFGETYSKSLRAELGAGIDDSVLVYGKGHSACYYPKKQLDAFGKHLSKKAEKDEEFIKWLCNELHTRADRMYKLVERLHGKKIGKSEYAQFLKELYVYIVPHISVKKLPDYLPQKLLKKHLAELEEARLYAEKVYTVTEEFMVEFGQQIARKEKIDAKLVLSMTKEEFAAYQKSGKMPETKILKQRYASTALVFTNGNAKLYSGKEAEKIERNLHAFSDAKHEVVGSTSYPGVVRGIARIVLRPERAKKFNDGDILVSSMTRPDFLPLIHKSAAVVTDGGGILSHAAIVARELKKPTVIGTQNATRTFKDGDLIEVDAARGIVRKIAKK